MTIKEAEKIFDVVTDALENKEYSKVKPRSLLKGYSNGQIVAALKIVLAKQFLQFSEGGRLDIFEKAVASYSSVPVFLTTIFEAQEFEPLSMTKEPIETFAKYCKSLETDDELYWQKIYTRIGLEYGSSSPKGGLVTEWSPSGPSTTILSVSESSNKSGCLPLLIGLPLVSGMLWFLLR